MQRFYIDYLDTKKDIFIIEDKDIIHQLKKVLRAKEGDDIILFDGNDFIDYLYHIENISKKEIGLTLKQRIEKEKQMKPSLHLYQSLPNKFDKLEYIIQKGVEVGYTTFNFFRAERSQKLSISEGKLKRLEKIIIEAVEQSNRNIIPELVIKKANESIFIRNGENVFFHTEKNNSQRLKELKTRTINNLNIFVGPEGGWSEAEVERFILKGFTQAYLGTPILRTETVSSVVAFYINQG